MMAIVLTIANFFGISPLRLIVYAGLTVAIVGGAITIRQHYINLGYRNAIAAVKKQDASAKAVADKVQQKADACAANSYWDVLTQSCKGDTP
jgi:hypothetical protein